MSNERLIPEFTETEMEKDHNKLICGLTFLADQAEHALVRVGAKPGIDYTYRDLFTWAVSISSAHQVIRAMDKLTKAVGKLDCE